MSTVSRTRFQHVVLDATGVPQASKAVTFYDDDGTTPFTGSLYAAATGGSPTTSFQTDARGYIEAYATTGKRVKATVVGVADQVKSAFEYDPADLLVQGMTRAALLDGYNSNDDYALTLYPQSSATLAKALHVKDDDGSSVVRVRKSAGFRNLILFGDDGSLPETTLVYASQSLTANSQRVATIVADVTVAGVVDVAALEAAASQTIAGGTNLAAAKFLASRGSSAAVGETVAVKGWIDSDKASGSPKLNVSFWASSIGTQAADTAFLADGSGGYTDFFRGYTSADALVARITAAGAASFLSLTTTAGIAGVNVSSSGALISTAASSAASPTLFFTGGAAGVAGMYSGAANVLGIGTNSTERMSFDAAGNVVVGTAALLTTATDGYLYIPTCAGAPTGVPTAKAGRVALIFDTTNNKWWAYDGGWIGVVLS